VIVCLLSLSILFISILGQEFALKILHKDKMSNENLISLKNEIAILSSLNHPNVIRYFLMFDVFVLCDFDIMKWLVERKK